MFPRTTLLAPLLLAACVQDDQVSGRALYLENCAACHGTEGRGDGPLAAELTTPPPDLTRIAARREGVWPMLEVMSVIDGYNRRTNPREEMPVFGDFLLGEMVPFDTGNGVLTPTPVNLIALVEYLETLQSPPPTSYVP